MTEKVMDLFNSLVFEGYKYFKGIDGNYFEYELPEGKVIIEVTSIAPENSDIAPISIDKLTQSRFCYTPINCYVSQNSLYYFRLRLGNICYSIPKLSIAEYAEVLSKLEEVAQRWESEKLDKFISVFETNDL